VPTIDPTTVMPLMTVSKMGQVHRRRVGGHGDADQTSPAAQGGEGLLEDDRRGGEDEGDVEPAELGDRGHGVGRGGVDGVVGAQLEGEVELGCLDVDRGDDGAHETRVLHGEVPEATDAEDADLIRRLDPGDLEGLVGGQSRAAQRGRVERADAVGHGHDIGRVGDGVLGERPVDGVAAVLLALAEGLAAVDAVSAHTAGGARPRDATRSPTVRSRTPSPSSSTTPIPS
jgi:hypothetical protein